MVLKLPDLVAEIVRELQAAGVVYRVPLAHNVLAYALTERGAALRETIDARRGGARQRSSDTRQRRRVRRRSGRSRADLRRDPVRSRCRPACAVARAVRAARRRLLAG